jgi:hypothetical protein
MPIRDSKRRFGAEYSACGLYRYSLWRAWPVNGEADRTILWIMLNPSKADHLGTNDPTIERCERRSVLWGFQRMDVVNLFALSATYPAALRSAADPIGPSNDAKIMERADTAAMILCAWGAHGNLGGRADVVRALLADRSLHCLGKTRSGEPAHPLYLPYDRAPVPYGRL